MYNLSDNALTFIRNGHPQKLRIVIQPQGSVSDIIIDETQVKSCSISRSCCSSDKIEIGSVSSAQLSLTIVNGTGETGSVDFSNINLEGAIIKVFCRVPNALSDRTYAYENVSMGVFTVDEQRRKNKYTGSLTAEINITAFDNVMRLDREIADGFAPGNSLRALANACCSACGLSLASATDTLIGNVYRYGSFTLPSSFNTENSKPTYREIIGCIAELCCCDCYADETNGYITFRKVKPNASETPFVFAESDRYSSDTKEEDTSVTGIFVKDLNGGTKTIGTTAYALQCEGNILLVNANQFADQTMPLITYRPFTANILSFPHLRPLDKVVYRVTKEAPEENIDIASVITSVTWSFNKGTTIGAAGMSQVRNGFAKGRVFTARQQKILDTMAQQQSQQLSDFEIATLNLNDRLQYSMGLFDTYKVEENGSKTHYYHNEKNLADSTYVVKFAAGGTVWTSGEGCWQGTTTVVDGVVVVTSDGETVWTSGFTSGGDAVLANIAAKKISAELLTIGTPAKVKNLVFDGGFTGGGAWHSNYWDVIGYQSGGTTYPFNSATFMTSGTLLLDLASDKPSGDYIVKHIVDDYQTIADKYKISIKPNTNYAFGFSVQFTGESDSYLAPMNMYVRQYTSNGQQTGSTIGLPYGSFTPSSKSAWKRYNNSFKTESNAAYVTVEIEITHTVGKRNHFDLDDVMLFETDEVYYTADTSQSPVVVTFDENFPFDDGANPPNGNVSVTEKGVDIYQGAISIYDYLGKQNFYTDSTGRIKVKGIDLIDGEATFSGKDDTTLQFATINNNTGLFLNGANPILFVYNTNPDDHRYVNIRPSGIYMRRSDGQTTWMNLYDFLFEIGNTDNRNIFRIDGRTSDSPFTVSTNLFKVQNLATTPTGENVNEVLLQISNRTETDLHANLFKVIDSNENTKLQVDTQGILVWGNVRVNGEVVHSSTKEVKTNIKPAGSMLSQVLSAGIYNYDYKSEFEKEGKKGGDPQHYGLVIGKGYNTPKEVIAKDGKGVDLYSMISLAWKAIQEQQDQIDELKHRIDKLENKGG